MTKRIFTLKLREIHQQILLAKNITQASKNLQVSTYDIELLLYYLPHPVTGEFLNLTFSDLKEHWEEITSGEIFWGDKYDQTVPEVQGDSKNLNIFTIHKEIHGNSGITSFKALAIHLKLSPNQTKKYLESFTVLINNEVKKLDFEILLSLRDEADFRKALHLDADIQQSGIQNKTNSTFFFVNEKSNLSALISINQKIIFNTLIQAKSLHETSQRLGAPDRLSHYLRKILMISGRTWQHEKYFSEIQLLLSKVINNKISFVYNPSTVRVLKDYRLYELHDLILRSSSIRDLCLFLNISEAEFNHFMNESFFCKYRQLYEMCVAECIEAWGLAYYLPIMEVEDDRRFSVAEIHHAILASEDVASAESSLGIPQNSLDYFLSYFQDEMYRLPLSFAQFKSLYPSIDHGKYAYGTAYNQIMRPVYFEPEDRTFFEIHQVIIASSTILEAAIQLQISANALNRQLSYITFWQDNELLSLTYDFVKINWPDVLSAEKAWGEDYFKTMSELKKEHEISFSLINNKREQPSLFNHKKRQRIEDLEGPLTKRSRPGK